MAIKMNILEIILDRSNNIGYKIENIIKTVIYIFQLFIFVSPLSKLSVILSKNNYNYVNLY